MTSNLRHRRELMLTCSHLAVVAFQVIVLTGAPLPRVHCHGEMDAQHLQTFHFGQSLSTVPRGWHVHLVTSAGVAGFPKEAGQEVGVLAAEPARLGPAVSVHASCPCQSRYLRTAASQSLPRAGQVLCPYHAPTRRCAELYGVLLL